MQQRARTPPSHLCGIVFPDIWRCPRQLGGSHEVRSHVLRLVTSVPEMFSNSDIFSVTWERLFKCTADPVAAALAISLAIFGLVD